MSPEDPANQVQPPAPGPGLQERRTCQRQVHQQGRRSHYSCDEIIMTGAPRPHHRNICCIIYLSGPLVQGENTYKLPGWSVSPHSLLFAAQSRGARSLSLLLFFPPFVVFFSVHQGPEASALWPDNLQPPSSLFISPVFVVFFLILFSHNRSGSSFSRGPQTCADRACGVSGGGERSWRKAAARSCML